MLTDTVKAAMIAAMKSGDTIAKEVYRTAMGELTTDAARPGRTGSDEEGFAILKKLLKGAEETRASLPEGDPRKADAAREIDLLSAFLPKGLSEADLVAALASVHEAIKAAPNDGAATGVAMKLVKAQALAADGKLVSAAVKAIRSA
jgi:uncharacterized protein YqeY